MSRIFILALALFSAPVLADVIDAGTEVVVMDPQPIVGALDADPTISMIAATAKAIHGAVKNKEWGRLVFLIITALVVLTRKFLAPRVEFFRGKLGAPLLAFLWAGAGALATAWPAGEALTMDDMWLTLQAGIMAAGGWSLLKNGLEHFYPKDPAQTNWATVIASIIGALTKPVEAPKPVA